MAEAGRREPTRGGVWVLCQGQRCPCRSCRQFLDLLWDAYPTMKSMLRRRGVDHMAADDLASQVFTVAWMKLDRVPRCPDESTRWLYGTASMLLRNHRRVEARARRHGERYAVLQAPLDATAWGQPEESVPYLLLLSAWQRLSSEDQGLLWQAGIQGLSPAALAEQHECSVGAIRTRLWRARSALSGDGHRDNGSDPSADRSGA